MSNDEELAHRVRVAWRLLSRVKEYVPASMVSLHGQMDAFLKEPAPPLPDRIHYRCNRCGVVELSGALPTDAESLKVYPLPEKWELISTPLGQDDHVRCWGCIVAVANGEPAVLAEAQILLGQALRALGTKES